MEGQGLAGQHVWLAGRGKLLHHLFFLSFWKITIHPALRQLCSPHHSPRTFSYCLLSSCSDLLLPVLQGSLYWRFNDGTLDPKFPRNISEGFQGIPNDVDAAIALPAENYLTNERVYFFKGDGLLPAWAEIKPSLPNSRQCSSAGAFFYHCLEKDTRRAGSHVSVSSLMAATLWW